MKQFEGSTKRGHRHEKNDIKCRNLESAFCSATVIEIAVQKRRGLTEPWPESSPQRRRFGIFTSASVNIAHVSERV